MDATTAEDEQVHPRRPWPMRIGRFVAERYPPAPQMILVVLLVLTGVTMAQTMWAPAVFTDHALTGIVDVSRLILTLVGGALFIFHLRLFDDVKDAETDRITAPTRPIPRGLVSERDVDLLALILLLSEAGIFALVGPHALAVWAIAAGYTLLMRVEFFIGSWLDRHVLTYAISHMVVLGMVLAALIAAGIDVLGLASATSPSSPFVSIDIVLACVAAVLLGIGFELGRKFERYEAAHGRFAWLALVGFPASGILLMVMATSSSYGVGVRTTLIALAAGIIGGGTVLMQRRPSPPPIAWEHHPTFREVVEAFPGIAGLVTYLACAIAGLTAVNWT